MFTTRDTSHQFLHCPDSMFCPGPVLVSLSSSLVGFRRVTRTETEPTLKKKNWKWQQVFMMWKTAVLEEQSTSHWGCQLGSPSVSSLELHTNKQSTVVSFSLEKTNVVLCTNSRTLSSPEFPCQQKHLRSPAHKTVYTWYYHESQLFLQWPFIISFWLHDASLSVCYWSQTVFCREM